VRNLFELRYFYIFSLFLNFIKFKFTSRQLSINQAFNCII